MAPLPDVPGVVKIALVFSDGINTDVVTRFYLEYSGTAPSAAELDTFCTGVHATFVPNLAAEMHEDLSLIRVEATDLSSLTGATGLDTSTDPGTASGDPVPLSAAVVSSYVISRRYRGGHPRGYWPLGAGAVLTNPQRWDAGFTVITNPITHRARNVPTLRTTPAVDAVSGTIARLRVGTQRRRLQYK